MRKGLIGTETDKTYVVGNKFILEEDKVDITTKEPEDEGRWSRRVVSTQIGHDTGAIVQMKVPMHEMKWNSLYDKNNDKLYVAKRTFARELLWSET